MKEALKVNFTTLAFNPLSRMSEVCRYSSVYQEVNETLAEHVAEVSTMSYLIAKKLISMGEIVNIGDLLEKCLLHDMDEVLTGDVPRNTKYATTAVHTELNKVADEAVKLIEAMLGDVSVFSVWSNAKSGKEGVILKIVDMLCVVKKCVTEIELRGNLSFLKVVSEVEIHLGKMLSDDSTYSAFDKDESKSLLRDLVGQAKDEVTTIRVRYQHIIDKYHIRENVIRGE